MWHAALRQGQIRQGQVVEQHEIGLHSQRSQRLSHRLPGCGSNADTIDRAGFHATNACGEGKLLDRAEEPFPLIRREALGVIDLAKKRRQDVGIRGQDHCRGDYRSRPRPAPDFIDTHDRPIPG